MKTAIVYYSMSGNTAETAGKLAGALGADLIEIKPEKAYPDKGIRKFLWGGMKAVMAETPALQPYEFRAEEYDRIVIGFPVWASNMAPPLRTFVKDNGAALADKKIAAFACQGGSGAEKALAKLAECLGREKLEASMILNDPKVRPSEENGQKIREFAEKLAAEE